MIMKISDIFESQSLTTYGETTQKVEIEVELDIDYECACAPNSAVFYISLDELVEIRDRIEEILK